MKNTSSFICFIQKYLSKALNFVFPPQCPYCDKIIHHTQMMCDNCFNQIHFITGSKCYRCGRPLPLIQNEEKLLCPNCINKRKNYDLSRSAFIYDSFSRNAILRLKHADRTDLRHLFVQYMLRAGTDLFEKTDLVVSVPLHWKRRFKRKYNQSAVLAELLAKKINKPYSTTLLTRCRYTHSQAGKDSQKRKENVKNAFKVNPSHNIEGLSILLIDDVLTTGATAESCAKILKQNGAKAVYVLTIAQVLQH